MTEGRRSARGRAREAGRAQPPPAGGAAARARALLDGVVDRVARAGPLTARPVGDGVDLVLGSRLVAALRPAGGAATVDVDPRAGAGDAVALRRLGSPHPDRARSAEGWRRVLVRTHADAARLVHALRPARDKATNEPLRPRDPLLEAGRIRVRRVTEPPRAEDGTRVFVDGAWPRECDREAARVDLWLPEVAPSRKLFEAFGAVPGHVRGFRRAYLTELRGGPKAELVSRLRSLAHRGPLTLLSSLRDLDGSPASVLAHAVSKGKTPRV